MLPQPPYKCKESHPERTRRCGRTRDFGSQRKLCSLSAHSRLILYGVKISSRARPVCCSRSRCCLSAPSAFAFDVFMVRFSRVRVVVAVSKNLPKCPSLAALLCFNCAQVQRKRSQPATTMNFNFPHSAAEYSQRACLLGSISSLFLVKCCRVHLM